MNTKNQRQLGGDLTAEPKPRHVDTPYLTAHECVIYLRLGSLRALYRLLNEHQLPHGRRGRIYLFDKRKLDRWVESCGIADSFGRRKAS